MQVHHIGYLVKDINASCKVFESLGYYVENIQGKMRIVYDAIRDVDIMFLTLSDHRIELISPKSDNSVVSSLMRHYKNTPYHICYETNEFENDMSMLLKQGFIQIVPPTPAPALEERDVVFLYSSKIGMIELLRNKKNR